MPVQAASFAALPGLTPGNSLPAQSEEVRNRADTATDTGTAAALCKGIFLFFSVLPNNYL